MGFKLGEGHVALLQRMHQVLMPPGIRILVGLVRNHHVQSHFSADFIGLVGKFGAVPLDESTSGRQLLFMLWGEVGPCGDNFHNS